MLGRLYCCDCQRLLIRDVAGCASCRCAMICRPRRLARAGVFCWNPHIVTGSNRFTEGLHAPLALLSNFSSSTLFWPWSATLSNQIIENITAQHTGAYGFYLII